MNKINTLLLLSAFSALSFPLMAMHKAIIPLNAHNAVEQRQTTIITIPIPPPESKIERLDITQDEPISYQKWADLLAGCHRNGLNYSIARVETYDLKNKIDHVHYYDARMLNEWIKNSRNRHDISTAYTNPNNALPMQKIDYFKISPTPNNTATFQCSYNDPFCTSDPKKLWSEILNDPLYSEFHIARQWHNGSKCKAQDFEKAYQCYERLSQQTINPEIAADAKLQMADMWRYGEGREKNIMQAIERYKEVADSSDYALSCYAIKACSILLEIYWKRAPYHVRNSPEYDMISLCFNRMLNMCDALIADHETSPSIKVFAKHYRARDYLRYAARSVTTYNLMLQYWGELADQHENPTIAQHAQRTLRLLNRWDTKLCIKFLKTHY